MWNLKFKVNYRLGPDASPFYFLASRDTKSEFCQILYQLKQTLEFFDNVDFPNFSCAMLLWTLNKRWQLPPLHPPSRRVMNCPTVRLSPSVTRGSGAQRPSSNPHSWEWNHAVSMKPPTTPS